MYEKNTNIDKINTSNEGCIYSRVIGRFQMHGSKSKEFEMKNGIKPGDNMSPLLL